MQLGYHKAKCEGPRSVTLAFREPGYISVHRLFIPMRTPSVRRLIGRTVYSSDGQRMGVIKAVASALRQERTAHVWIQRGKDLGDGCFACLRDKYLRAGHLVVKGVYIAWTKGVPMHR